MGAHLVRMAMFTAAGYLLAVNGLSPATLAVAAAAVVLECRLSVSGLPRKARLAYSLLAQWRMLMRSQRFLSEDGKAKSMGLYHAIHHELGPTVGKELLASLSLSEDHAQVALLRLARKLAKSQLAIR